jgi:7-carboxy-7-deazaguanine synthase
MAVENRPTAPDEEREEGGPSTPSRRALSTPKGRAAILFEKQHMLATATLRVNETFLSVQGEGSAIGAPTFFIRLDGCPLRCAWCDTPYALAGTAGVETTPEQLVARSAGAPRIVITGGEPLAQDIGPLTASLAGRHITVETSGTIFADLPRVALFSISPKVGSSGYQPKPATLRKFCASAGGRMQLKFVIADARDYEESLACAESIADALPPGTPIILQPESASAGKGDAYVAALRALTEKTVADERWQHYDVRVLPQLHHMLWGGEPGR